MFGLRKQLGPLVDDAHDTLASVRDQLGVLVVSAVAILLVTLATLTAVLFR